MDLVEFWESDKELSDLSDEELESLEKQAYKEGDERSWRVFKAEMNRRAKEADEEKAPIV